MRFAGFIGVLLLAFGLASGVATAASLAAPARSNITQAAPDHRAGLILSRPVLASLDQITRQTGSDADAEKGLGAKAMAGRTVSPPLALAVFNWARDALQTDALVQFLRGLFGSSDAHAAAPTALRTPPQLVAELK